MDHSKPKPSSLITEQPISTSLSIINSPTLSSQHDIVSESQPIKLKGIAILLLILLYSPD